MNKLYVVGIGPGGHEHMTYKAVKTLKESDAIVGYTPYINYVRDFIEGKEIYNSGMTGEVDRCKKAIEIAMSGKVVSVISTGDAGLYGMAGLILELSKDLDLGVEIVPGVTSAFSSAAEIGAPIMHDLAIISLSDLLTPWELIEKRVRLAAEGDFVIAIYNPRSKGRSEHLKNAVDIMLQFKSPDTPVGIVKHAGRENVETTLATLGTIDYEAVDMNTTLIIGNRSTEIYRGKMITKRGYDL